MKRILFSVLFRPCGRILEIGSGTVKGVSKFFGDKTYKIVLVSA